MITRRTALATAAAALAVPLRARAEDGFDLTPEELQDLLDEAADPFFDPASAIAEKGLLPDEWTRLPRIGTAADWDWNSFRDNPGAKPAAPALEDSADTAHLTRFSAPPSSFALTAAVLADLAERNSFVLDTPRVLFGLRGAVLASGRDDSGWSGAIDVALATVDHQSFRCLLGVWDRQSGLVRAFAGSTAPHVASMWRQYHWAAGANQLSTGLYAYVVGGHNLSSTRSFQMGAFRLAGAGFPGAANTSADVVVLRSLDDLTFSPKSRYELWDRLQPWNNIHSAVFDPGGKRTYDYKFSSAGCQILKGAYALDAERRFTSIPVGPWAEFRVAAGLAPVPTPKTTLYPKVSTEDGLRFQYILLAGYEAALAAQNAGDYQRHHRPVRFGSTGPRVAEVQARIGAGADGRFGPGTAVALLKHQRDVDKVMETGVAV